MSVRSASIGLAALGANPLRTALSTSGVVIGVAALVSVLALGDGVERFTREQFANTTSLQSIVVSPRTSITVDGVRVPGTSFPTFTPADAQALLSEVAGVSEAQMRMSGSGRIRIGDSTGAAIVTGFAGFPGGAEPALERGRWPAREEAASRVAVVTSGLATRLQGDTLLLEGQPWTVIGVLKAGAADSIHRVLVPLSVSASGMVPSEWPRAPDLILKAARIEEVEATKAKIEQWLAARDASWKSGVTIQTQTQRARQARQGVLLFKILMGAVTGISLIVGGIGIMNVLLASVAERTREIGIRKAAGARHRDILVQFLAESVAITGVGSLAGVLLGLATGFGVAAFMRAQTGGANVRAVFTWSSAGVAVAAAVIVGLVFGIYPALRAARLSPIDAIRHE
jgi:putative ABC transport system permease protein